MKEKIELALKSIVDPKKNKDIVELGYINDITTSDTNISVSLSLPQDTAQFLDQLKHLCHTAVHEQFPNHKIEININILQGPAGQSLDGLKKVKKIIAISSCKGGVGKSTLAVNIASLLAKKYKVGIFDADIYGPSLPTMIQTDTYDLEPDGDYIHPIIGTVGENTLKAMSFGYAQEYSGDQGPAILRGPIVSQILNQLLTSTRWGELDYLIIDLPPGTGDIQLTLGQMIPIDAAVIITTPQYISFIDVVKGIEMFDTLNIPTLGVIENMNHFICNNCDEKHHIFGMGALKKLVEEFGFENTLALPMEEALAHASDQGEPYIASYPDSDITIGLELFLNKLIKELDDTPNLKDIQFKYEGKKGISLTKEKGETIYIDPYKLRKECKCAHCRDELTGDIILKENQIQKDIHPISLTQVGQYALGVFWSDEHSSIFPFKVLETIK